MSHPQPKTLAGAALLAALSSCAHLVKVFRAGDHRHRGKVAAIMALRLVQEGRWEGTMHKRRLVNIREIDPRPMLPYIPKNFRECSAAFTPWPGFDTGLVSRWKSASIPSPNQESIPTSL